MMERLRNYDLLTRTLRTRPVLVASLFYALGCVSAFLLQLPLWICAAVFLLPIFASFVFRKFRSVFLIICIFAVGMTNFTLQWNGMQPVQSQTDVQITGRVSDEPYYNTDTQRLVITLRDVTANGSRLIGKLRLYLRDDDDPTAIENRVPEIGQSIECSAHLWQASDASNPGQFNFSNYLRINGIAGYATAKSGETEYGSCVRSITDLPVQIRTYLSKRIDSLFTHRADIAKAFLIGDRSEIGDEDKDAFAESGIAHLLAISGMHISLISYMLMQLLNRFLNRKLAFSVTFFLLVLYGILLGFPASLFRAIFMFGMSGFGAFFGRQNDPLTSLALSMLVYLLWKPLQILGTGFELSYGATAGILLLYKPLEALLHVNTFLHRRIEHGIGREKVLLLSIGRYLVESVLVTLSAQIAVLPIVIYAYGSQSILSFLTGIVTIPTAMLAYVIAIPAVIFNLQFLSGISDALFSLLVHMAHLASSLPVTAVRIARFPMAIVILHIIMCFAASELSKFPMRVRRFIPLFVIPAMLIADLYSYIPSLGTSVIFMDAGQADCAVIRSGGKIYLVDTGDDYSPAPDYLSAMNYSVEGIFITHPHTDHTGGIMDILDVCTPKYIYTTPNWELYEVDESVTEAMEACKAAGTQIVTVTAGDSFKLAGGAEIEVLYPNAGFEASSANEDSLLLQLKYGDASVMFTGDASAENIENEVKDSDILKVPHHGSATALSEKMLESISPSACVISVGYNTYGHPTQDALNLIELSGASLYRTDLNGAITCRLHTDGTIDIKTYR